VTLFLQIFVLVGSCYVGIFAHGQIRRTLRRRRRRRAWRALDTTVPRRGSRTPVQPV
jgi:hypothetical protein